jgi:hypothetical protein
MLAVVSVALLVLAACSSDDDEASSSSSTSVATTTTTGVADAKPTLLFVQSAGSAVVSDADGGEYLVDLGEVDASTVFFTDRPNRRAGTESTQELVDRVVNSDVPPNAAMVWRANGAEEILVVELLEGNYDEGSATLQYRFRILEGGSDVLVDFESTSDVPEGELGPVSLYVDSFSSRKCEVNFVNSGSADLVYGDITMEGGSILESGPVSISGRDYPVDTDQIPDSDFDGLYVTLQGGQWNNDIAEQNFFYGETTSSYYVIDHNDFGDGCSGSIEILSNDDAAVTYHFDNPYVGSDTHSVDCVTGFTCSINNQEDGDTLKDTVTISARS